MPNDENITDPIQEPLDTPVTKVTDDDLSAAYDSLFVDEPEEPEQQVPPVVEPPVVPPTPPVEDDLIEPSHEEKSRLGRRVSELANNMVTKDDLNALLEKIEKLQTPSYVQPSTPLTQTEEDEIADITNVKELDAFLERREQKKIQKEQEKITNYRKTYVETLKELTSDLDKETFNEVFNTMKTKYDDVRSPDNPAKDCALNFAKAMKEVTVSKLSNANQFEKNKGVIPPTPTPPVQSDAIEKPMPELDPIAADFVKRVGMSAQQVNEALAKSKPNLLGKKRVL